MAILNVYLTFNGNCEQAFNFYQSIFGGKAAINRFGEMPSQEGAPPMSEEEKNKIMHVSLPISKETILMGSDTGSSHSSYFVAGNNFSLSVTVDSKEEADKIFSALSENANITMPIAATFWGDYFGMLADQFGVQWMVSFPMKQEG